MKKAHRPYGLEAKAVLAGLVLGRLAVAYAPAPREAPDRGYAVPDSADPYGRTLAHLFVAPAGFTPPSAETAPEGAPAPAQGALWGARLLPKPPAPRGRREARLGAGERGAAPVGDRKSVV